MKRMTEQDEFGNAGIIGVENAELQQNLSFDDFNRVTAALNRLAAYENTDIEPQDMVMEMDYGDKKVRLRRCPFCGSAPLIHGYRNRMRQWYRIRCSNEKEICRMIPETSASRTLEEAAADWNMMPKEETA